MRVIVKVNNLLNYRVQIVIFVLIIVLQFVTLMDF